MNMYIALVFGEEETARSSPHTSGFCQSFVSLPQDDYVDMHICVLFVRLDTLALILGCSMRESVDWPKPKTWH